MKKSYLSYSIANFVEAAKSIDPELAAKLSDDMSKAEVYAQIESMGLKAPHSIVTTPAEFLADIDGTLAQMHTKFYYVKLESSTGATPIRKPDGTKRTGLVKIVRDAEAKFPGKFDRLTIVDFLVPVYSGIIACPDGEYLDISVVSGHISEYTNGGMLDFQITRDNAGIFSYEAVTRHGEDTPQIPDTAETRRLFFRVANTIPHTDGETGEYSLRHRRYQRGNYEFVLVQGKNGLETFFMDYIDKPAYTLADIHQPTFHTFGQTTPNNHLAS